MPFDNVRLMPPPDSDGQTKLKIKTDKDICVEGIKDFSFPGLVLLMNMCGSSSDKGAVIKWVHKIIELPEDDAAWEDIKHAISNIRASNSPSFKTVKPRTWLVMGDQTIIGVFDNEGAARNAETYFAEQGVITKLYEIDILNKSPFTNEPARQSRFVASRDIHIGSARFDEDTQRVTWNVSLSSPEVPR